MKKPTKSKPSPKSKSKTKKGEKVERAMREDLITQACLEAYGAVRHEKRLADRALE